MKELLIDLRGQICPSTLLQTLKVVNENKKGLRERIIKINVATDNRDALTTIPDVVEKMGFNLTIKKERNYYIITIKKD